MLSETVAAGISTVKVATADATEQLRKKATAHGGVSGERFVIFHGEVNEDSVGPIEVCIPVATESAATRRERAHRQAYVVVTKAQFGWPQILSAYDAVEQWIDQQNRHCIGSPREMYRADVEPASARPTDKVCEVAFPIG